MPLATGQTLSFYEVLGPLGAGGMGEVYRARDTRLEREVAIKVLPEHFAADEERLRRFEREAKTLASLSHANVAHVYGIDQVDDTCFIAMELVPGEDLGERQRGKALPVDVALDVCCQIAAGLAAAHEAGVIHRDLKPANVCITPDGVVKLLDFGLAKSLQANASSSSATVDPSGMALTGAGVVLGTPTYMSPEQARGRPVDRRTDVWAFGCVLFECLTGTRAFAGDTLSDVLAAVLQKTPDWSRLPARTPARVRELVRQCLAKDPNLRLRDMGDVGLLLAEARSALAAGDGGDREAEAPALGRYRFALASLAFLAVITTAFALAGALGSEGGAGPSATRVAKWSLGLPAGSELGWHGTSANLSKLGGGSPLLAISPDGERVAYCANHGGESRLYVHDLGEEFEGRPIPHTENARGPFFSPDGDWIGFFANDALQIVSVEDGGAAQTVCKLSSPNFAGCWTAADTIVYSTNSGLWRVSSGGGEPERLTSPRRADDELEHSGPEVLPDGDTVLFTVSTGTRSHIDLLSLETKEQRTIVQEGANPRFQSGGWLLYAQAGGIRRVPFDPDSTQPMAVSDSVQTGIFTTPSAGGSVITHFAVAKSGTLVYAPAVRNPPRSSVSWVDREGLAEEITGGLGIWEHPRLSPDGSSFAVDILDALGTKDVWIYTFDGSVLSPVTENGTSVLSSWRGADEVVVRSLRMQNEISLVSTFDRSSRLLVGHGGPEEALFADSWSRDGQTVILTRKTAEGRSIWSFTVGDAGPAERIGSESQARYGELSPDGRWLAYVRDSRGRGEVYVQPYPKLDRAIPVSIAGGGEPMWSKDGRGLYYRVDATMFFVPVETEPTFRADSPQELFTAAFDAEPGGHRHYDLSTDAERERFLMIEHHEERPERIRVVLDWLAETASER